MADDKEETGVEPEVTTASEDTVETPETETDELDPIEAIAKDIGWKPADEFIRTGRDVQRTLAKDLKALKSNMENMSRTSATLLQAQLADRDAYWASQHQSAVEQGDYQAVDYAQQQRSAVQQEYARNTRPVVTNEAAEFAERNKGWFQKDPLATRRAFEITETYAQAGRSAGEQLEAAEKQVRKEFPELFGSAKPPPSVNGNGSRTTSVSGRKKGFHDMPADAQAMAKEYVEMGLIPSADTFVTTYFASKK